MFDKELDAFFPGWSTMSKKQQDKIWKEYQTFSFDFSKEAQKEFNILANKADALDRKRAVIEIPNKLQARDAMSLMLLMERWEEAKGEQPDDPREQKEYAKGMQAMCRDLWDNGSTSILNALNIRDDLISLHVIELVKELSIHNGIAVRSLRSPANRTKLCAWIEYVLDDNRRLQPLISTPPIQHAVLVMLQQLILGCSKDFIQAVMAPQHNIYTKVVMKLKDCCPSLIFPICNVIDIVILQVHNHNLYNADNQIAIVLCQMGATMLARRAVQFDFASQEKYRGSLEKFEQWVDIGEIAGPIAHSLMLSEIFFQYPTPPQVKRHLLHFGSKYTDREPTDLLERKRWSNRYFCMRVGQVDFTTPEGQEDGAEMKYSHITKHKEKEEARMVDIQCAKCRVMAQDGESSFKRCSKCRMIYYCSSECQREHWAIHRKECQQGHWNVDKPENLMDLTDSIERLHRNKAGSTDYPTVFAVWLKEKYAPSLNKA